MPRSAGKASSIIPDGAWAHAIYIVTMLGVFAADIVLPRGATPAIGYCLVPVFARRFGDRRLLLVLTGTCTLLTWIALPLEQPGAAPWMPVFDRTVVTGVLWLTLLVVSRQMKAELALAHQARALQHAVDELHRSNAELESFASIVSHDIRGPLNSMALAIKLISSRPSIEGDPESAEWLGQIADEVSRMSALVQTLLAYARVGAAEVHLSDCDCEAVLARVRQALRAELENSGAELTHDALPTISAEPALMAELFQNLVENAIKYRSESPPRIHVSASASGEGWRFSVRDNGIGMSAADRARVFDPFYRASGSRSSAGVGLGLATCKRIIDRHGGTIEVQSTLGEGSTFSFFVPRPPSRQAG